MTKIITRYFNTASTANSVASDLKRRHGFPPRIVSVHTSAEGLTDALANDSVDAATAQAYQDRIAEGGGVVVVRAAYRPLGVARIAREVMADFGAVDMGGLTEEVVVPDAPGAGTSILPSHPLLMTVPRREGSKTVHMAEWPIPLIIRRKPFDRSLSLKIGTVTGRILPLLSRRTPSDRFAFPRHARMAAFPIRLLSKREPKDKFAFPRHARMANFPIPLISKRKPYDRMAFGRHQRMANWPFPLLITDEPGRNALIPGGPRMANFPIPLLSKREPSDTFAFPRHARMANWPIPLISRRSPSKKRAVSNHNHMADVGLPLILSETEEGIEGKGKRFTFSGLFGWPTLTRRKTA